MLAGLLVPEFAVKLQPLGDAFIKLTTLALGLGLVLVLSVDWFMGIARALGKRIGNCAATVAIAAWEGGIDREPAHAVLDGKVSAAIDTGLIDEALPAH